MSNTPVSYNIMVRDNRKNSCCFGASVRTLQVMGYYLNEETLMKKPKFNETEDTLMKKTQFND